MAKLPDDTALGRSGELLSRRPIASFDLDAISKAGEVMGTAIARSGQVMGEAIASEGKSIGKGLEAIGEGAVKAAQGYREYIKHSEDLEFARGQADKLTLKAKADTEFENDRDHATLLGRYQKRMADINAGVEGTFSNPRVAERFRMWAAPRDALADGVITARARKVKDDIDTAGAVDGLTKLRNTALLDPDPLARIDVIKTAHGIINGMMGRGLISAVNAQRMRETWTIDYAKSAYEILPPEARIEALSEARGKSKMVDFLPEDQRVAMLERAKAQFLAEQRRTDSDDGLERYNTERMTKDDLASVLATGEGGDERVINDRLTEHFGEDAAQKWWDARMKNAAIWTNTHDLYSLNETQIAARLESLRPKSGAPDFANDQAVYEEVEKRVDELRKERNLDPAKSVERDPAVLRARTEFDPKKPETYGPLIAARLAAQIKAGLPEDHLSPITKDEAIALTVPLRRMLPGQERATLTELGKTFQSLFGKHADEAFQYALRVHKVDAEVARTSAALMKKLGLGEGAIEASRRTDEAIERSEALKAIGVGPWDDPAAAPPPVPPAVAPPPAEPPTTATIIPRRAIEALRDRKYTPADFDKKYGPGSAKKVLDTYTIR